MNAFAALGDSFTAGTASEPGASWADLLAERLRERSPGMAYRNLAVEGTTTAEMLEGQLPAAIEMEPDLVSVICGANDVFLTVRPRPDEAIANLAEAFDAIRGWVPGALLMTATVPERWRLLGLRPRTRDRVGRGIRELNEGIRSLAAERGMPCLDVATHPGLNDATNFCDDGLHASAIGHVRTADSFAGIVHAYAPINEWTGVA